MSMNYSSRFWLYAPLALFLGLAGWAMAYWWVVATALDRKLNALNGHEAIPGITLSYSTKTISGFPFNIDVVFTGFKVEGAGAHGPFAWHSERFALHALTYGAIRQIYEMAGQQSLSWQDGSGKLHHITFLPATMRASADLNAKGLNRFDLDIMGAGGKDSDGAPFTIARTQFHMRHDPKIDALDIMISADQAKTSSLSFNSLSAYSTLSHGVALAPLLAGKQSWPQATAAWRTAGGAAEPGKRAADTGMDIGGVTDRILSLLY
jgi:hypothetical protein